MRAVLIATGVLALSTLHGASGAAALVAGPSVPACAGGAAEPADAFCRQVETLGRFEQSRAGPIVDGRPTIEVLVSSAWGTGVREQTVALLADASAGYRVLWSHVTLNMSPSLPAAPGPDVATTYQWRFDPRSDRIQVTGVRTVGTIISMWSGDARGKKSALPTETYCYQRASATFAPCS